MTTSKSKGVRKKPPHLLALRRLVITTTLKGNAGTPRRFSGCVVSHTANPGKRTTQAPWHPGTQPCHEHVRAQQWSPMCCASHPPPLFHASVPFAPMHPSSSPPPRARDTLFPPILPTFLRRSEVRKQRSRATQNRWSRGAPPLWPSIRSEPSGAMAGALGRVQSLKEKLQRADEVVGLRRASKFEYTPGDCGFWARKHS